MSDAELNEAAGELYSLDPSDFVEARTAAATKAKASGDRALSVAIGKLRKPTTVGWAVNLLVREDPEDIADLFDIGDSLREAQRKSQTSELRELSAARQKAIRALTTRAGELVRGHGKALDDNASREVAQTLGAALADLEIAERVRSGRVLTAESYSGFGPAALSLVPESEPVSHSESGVATESESGGPAEVTPENTALRAKQDALRLARESLAEAQVDEKNACRATDSADADLDNARGRLAEVKERLARLRAELHAAEEEEAHARTDEKSAERESRRLHRVAADASARTSTLKDAVDDLVF